MSFEHSKKLMDKKIAVHFMLKIGVYLGMYCRSVDFYWRRGGNASNSSSVLSLLGADVELFGTLPKDQKPELEYVF